MCNTAFKYIHVRNHVPLGAGGTVASKRDFETWLLEEAHVNVKHYYSDTRVFKTELFTKSCKEDGQIRSFNRVGEQCQNAEVERAMQTRMYMVRSFMLYAALK